MNIQNGHILSIPLAGTFKKYLFPCQHFKNETPHVSRHKSIFLVPSEKPEFGDMGSLSCMAPIS